MIHDGGQVSIGYLGEDLPDSTTNVFLVLRIGYGSTM